MNSSYFELFQRRYEIRVEQDVFARSFHVHDDSSTASQTQKVSQTRANLGIREFYNYKKHLGRPTGRIQNMDRGPWTTPWTWSMDHPMDAVHGTSPWTTPNFQKEIVPDNI